MIFLNSKLSRYYEKIEFFIIISFYSSSFSFYTMVQEPKDTELLFLRSIVGKCYIDESQDFIQKSTTNLVTEHEIKFKNITTANIRILL